MAISEIPATLNISCAAQLSKIIQVELKDVHGDAFSAASYAGFHGQLRNDTTNEEATLGVGVSTLGNNVLELTFPPLKAGVWRYEVWATADSGSNDRFIVGIFSALDAIVSHAKQAETPYTATLVIGEDNKVISARFYATTEAMLYAQQAEAAIDSINEILENAEETIQTKVDEIVREATDGSAQNALAAAKSAKEAAQSAEDAADSRSSAATYAAQASASARDAQSYANETSNNVKIANAFLAQWEETVYTLIWIGDDGNWHVGVNGSPNSINTGIKAQGENGKTPIIGNDNCWWLWDEESETYESTSLKAVPEDGRSPYINALGNWSQWNQEAKSFVDTGVQAEGKDGLDGTSVRRIMVNSYEDIPQTGDTCNGGFYYYVPKTGHKQYEVTLTTASPSCIFVCPDYYHVPGGTGVLVNGTEIITDGGIPFPEWADAINNGTYAVSAEVISNTELLLTLKTSVDSALIKFEANSSAYDVGSYFKWPASQIKRQLTTLDSTYSFDTANASKLVFAASRNWTAGGEILHRLGIKAGWTKGSEPSSERLYAHVYFEDGGIWWYAGRSAKALAQVADTITWWDFDRLLVGVKSRIQLLFSQNANEPSEENLETVRVVCANSMDNSAVGGLSGYCALAYWQFEKLGSDIYDVYAWVEDGGASGWILVREAYDVATTEVYGLNKLGTDMKVSGGSPVGHNEDGQMYVPMADSVTAGAVRISSTDVPEQTAAMHNIGMRSDGSISVLDANYDRYGSTRPSSGETEIETADMRNIAKTDTGRLITRKATRTRYGTVKLGSDFSTLNPIPYQHGISATANGELANNLLYSGAIQHRKRASWMATGSALALKLAEDYPSTESGSYFNSTDYYMGLLTTNSFTQDPENGLSLVQASSSILGGVKFGSVSSGSHTTVPTGSTVYTYLVANYCSKSHLEQHYWTAEEIQDWAANTPVTDIWVREQHAIMKQEVADTYLSKADAEATYYTIASANSTKKALETSIKDVQTRLNNTLSTSISQLRTEVTNTIETELIKSGNSGISKLVKISASDFSNLSAMSADTLYIITA